MVCISLSRAYEYKNLVVPHVFVVSRSLIMDTDFTFIIKVWRAWPCIKMLCWVNTRRSCKLSCFKVGWHFEVEYFAYLWPWWIRELYLVDSEDMAMMFTFWRRCGFCGFICLSNVSMVHLCRQLL